MKSKLYIAASLLVFAASTVGSDVLARVTIAGETPAYAFSDHMFWASRQLVGTVILAAPFALVALICSSAQRKIRLRSVISIFSIAMIALFYFYLTGYLESQKALIDERWTAATLLIGLLPIFRGIPIVICVAIASGLAKKWDPKPAAQG